jgi:hypothetical protein
VDEVELEPLLVSLELEVVDFSDDVEDEVPESEVEDDDPFDEPDELLADSRLSLR